MRSDETLTHDQYAARASALAVELLGDPASPQLASALAFCLNRLGHPAAAVALARRVPRIAPDLGAHLGGLAIILRECGESAAALACYRRALVLAPSSFETMIGLTSCLAGHGEPSEATVAFGWLDRLPVSTRPEGARRKVAGSRLAHRLVRAAFGDRVRHGPFAGTAYPDNAMMHVMAPKLIGCYEAELHRAIPTLLARRYDRIVHIGSADGYYAGGIGRLLPDVPTIAVDIDPAARAATLATARANGLDIAVAEQFSADLLGRRTLLVSDCEGAEVELLCGSTIDRRRISGLIVETHPWSVADRTGEPTFEAVRQAFAPTHELVAFQSNGGRSPSDFPTLAQLPRRLRPYAVFEGRGRPTPWLVGRLRSD